MVQDVQTQAPHAGDSSPLVSPLVMLLTLCASAFSGGLLLLSWGAATRLAVFLAPPETRPLVAGGFDALHWLVSAGLLLTMGLTGGALGLLRLRLDRTVPAGPHEQIYRYNIALVGVGLALVLVASMHFVALAGFAHMGQLRSLLRPEPISLAQRGAQPAPSITRGVIAAPVPGATRFAPSGSSDTVRLVFLPGFAVLGGLFFVAGSLRRKRSAMIAALKGEKGIVRFDTAHFWGGLWYRIGEAILFTLVLYLAVHSGLIDVGAQNQTLVLLLGLLLGMFVKPAEQLINGLGLRMLDGISAFVSDRGPAAPAGRGDDRQGGTG